MDKLPPWYDEWPYIKQEGRNPHDAYYGEDIEPHEHMTLTCPRCRKKYDHRQTACAVHGVIHKEHPARLCDACVDEVARRAALELSLSETP